MAIYKIGGGMIIALGATTVEQTGFIAGRTYEFTVSCAGTAGAGSTALVKWGGDNATIADAGFDFAVPQGTLVRAVCPASTTACNVIEAEAGTVATATVVVAEVERR